MLRTTSKPVVEGLITHVLENFQPENYDPTSGKTAMENLREQINHMIYGDKSVYQAALDYVEGGSLLVYYDSQREFLRELLQETKEEADRYDDDKVFKLYCHLCARTISQLYGKGTE